MNTILSAFDKRSDETDGVSNPDSILERNAAHRLALQQGRRLFGRERTKIILSGVCLGLAIAAVLVMTVIMTRPPAKRPQQTGQAVASDPRAAVRPSPTAPEPARTPVLREPLRTPVIHESVRLRTHPLLRPVVTAEPQPSGPKAVYPVATAPRAIASMPVPPPAPETLPVLEPVTTRTSTAASKPPAAPKPTAKKPTPRPTPDDPREFLSLTGMLHHSDKPSALINGRIVRIGEQIEGAKLLAIDSGSSVRVEYKGREYTITMK